MVTIAKRNEVVFEMAMEQILHVFACLFFNLMWRYVCDRDILNNITVALVKFPVLLAKGVHRYYIMTPIVS